MNTTYTKFSSFEEKPFHKHIMLRGHINKVPSSMQDAISFLKYLVESLDMKILQGPYASYVDKPGNKGLTAIVMIETSHIAFHIWDEQDPALIQLDIYTCGALDSTSVLKTLHDYFDFESYKYLFYDRENDFSLARAEEFNK